MVYGWKINYPVPAQVAGEHLENLKQQNGGIITPQIVLDDSRDEQAVLHSCFTWDDSVAAENYRLYQARKIISSLTVTVEKINAPEEPKMVTALVNISPLRTKGKYVSVEVAMNDVAYREQVLQNALSELRAFQNKYSTYKELAGVCKAIDDFAETITAK